MWKFICYIIGAIASVGFPLAICMSWTAWESIGWAIWHGILGWIYVIYYASTYM